MTELCLTAAFARGLGPLDARFSNGLSVVLGASPDDLASLCELLAGVRPARQGSVTLEGDDVGKRAGARRRVLSLLREAELFARGSVRDALTEACELRRSRAAVEDWLSAAGLSALGQRAPRSLSLHARRAAALAFALGADDATAHALYDNIVALAGNVATLDREVSPGAASEVESEISTLEAQANPFDQRASEERVRRLAHLKRQRRAVADLETRRERSRERLESCLLALENMRLDVLKLKAGSQTLQQITQVAERARELASEVDNAMYVADEMAKLKGGNRESGTGRR
jgi:ABC-type sugar transport system ATPase subunit